MHILHVARIRHMYTFKGEMYRQRYKHNTTRICSNIGSMPSVIVNQPTIIVLCCVQF